MTARDFDPAFSAALRNELAARADRPLKGRARAFARLSRPQVWVTAVTALVLLLATVGVLRLVAPAPQPASPGSSLIDPLTSVTQPSNASYVARAVDVLLHARGVGTGTRSFDVPPGTGSLTVYVACTGSGNFRTEVDGKSAFSSGCSPETGTSGAASITPGRHSVTVHVGAGVAYAVLGIRTPDPTVAAGAVIDPLTAVRDRHTPDALVGDTRPVLRMSGTRTSGVRAATVPEGVGGLRVLLVCQPSAAATRVRIDGHQVLGCMNSVAHWFDFTPRSRTISAQVVSVNPTDWRLLVVPAPAGAHDSPANALLPYPAQTGVQAVLAQTRGVGGTRSGHWVRRTAGILLDLTCRGTGWLEVRVGDGGTGLGRGGACAKAGRDSVGIGGPDEPNGKRVAWTAIPHGDISWTLTIRDDG